MSMAIPVPALQITATDILIRTAVAADDLATAIGCATVACATVARLQATHGVTLWFDTVHTDPTRRPNRAAVCLLLNFSDLEEDAVPIPAGDVVLTGTDPDTGGPAELTPRAVHSAGHGPDRLRGGVTAHRPNLSVPTHRL